jgi:putative sterol carrier protein
MRLNRRERAVPDFILSANIAHYKEILARETDARKVAALGKLLAEEEAKLAIWQQAKNPSPKAAE